MTVHIAWALDTLIEEFKHHHRSTRGLRDRTLHGYAHFVCLFVRSALGDDPIDPTLLRPVNVIGFVAAMTDRYSPRSMKLVRTARLVKHGCAAAVRWDSTGGRRRNATQLSGG